MFESIIATGRRSLAADEHIVLWARCRTREGKTSPWLQIDISVELSMKCGWSNGVDIQYDKDENTMRIIQGNLRKIARGSAFVGHLLIPYSPILPPQPVGRIMISKYELINKGIEFQFGVEEEVKKFESI